MTSSSIQQSYVICTTPRSGSNFLCEVLQATGVAGHPDEYFWNPPAGHEDWTLAEWEAYVDQIRQEGTTPNGVFGLKIMWGYFGETASRLASLRDQATASPPEILAATFPNLRYVHLTRRDKVRQGISWYRAMKTERWRSADAGTEGAPTPVFDFEAIHYLANVAANDDRAWQGFFAQHGIEPLVVVYEELERSPEQVSRQILDFLQLSTPERLPVPESLERTISQPPRGCAPHPFCPSPPQPSSPPVWRHQRQADALTDAWVQQYHALKGTAPT
ncbi:MAG: Stf0 family sulfotransferase [Chloroflexota bacterium]